MTMQDKKGRTSANKFLEFFINTSVFNEPAYADQFSSQEFLFISFVSQIT